MAIDFRASQVQTNKIISSGSTGTNAKILIYDIAGDVGGADGNQGQINPDVFSTASIGEDVYLFVSGWSGSLGTSTAGATVFGGDVRISGSLITDGSSSVPIGALSAVSGTNFGSGESIFSVLSSSAGSEILNFRTITAGRDLRIETSGDTITLSSSNTSYVLSPASSITMNLSSSTVFRYSLSQDTTVSMSSAWNGATGILKITHDATVNAYALSWSSDFRRMSSENLDPTQASGAVDIYSFVVDEDLVYISKAPNWIAV